jgi:hypothetical protein
MQRIATTASLLVLALAATAQADATTSPGSPAQQCRTERAGMGVTAFKATYGTNRSRSNAFGKCVSKRAKAAQSADQQGSANAPQKCRAEQTDPNFPATHGGKTFAQFYGTNHSGKNAFGKCVSKKARAESLTTQQNQVDAHINAAKSCKAERTSIGKDAFDKKYGTNRNRRNAFGKCVSKKARELQSQKA